MEWQEVRKEQIKRTDPRAQKHTYVCLKTWQNLKMAEMDLCSKEEKYSVIKDFGYPYKTRKI